MVCLTLANETGFDVTFGLLVSPVTQNRVIVRVSGLCLTSIIVALEIHQGGWLATLLTLGLGVVWSIFEGSLEVRVVDVLVQRIHCRLKVPVLVCSSSDVTLFRLNQTLIKVFQG